MANNLRYLLEHFCLDGQKIDISSQLDEENANNIEKINTQTVPSINARIDDIKNTDIPNINRQVDSIKNTDIPSINQKINTINNTTIPNVQANITAVDEKADRINESVAKNTRDIGTLSDNVTMQGNSINSINTEKIPSIENKVKIVGDETSSNTSNIASLTTNVNELTTNVSANTDSINDLTSKVSTNTDSINTINNTSIPHLQAEIDSLSSGGTGSVGELREKVEKNTADISTLSGKVDTNTSAISSINGTSIPNLQNQIDNVTSSLTFTWDVLMNEFNTPKGFIVTAFINQKLHLIQLHARLSTPQTIESGEIKEIIPNFSEYTPHYTTSSAIYIDGYVDARTIGIFTAFHESELTLSFKLGSFNFPSTLYGSLLYYY